MEETNKGAVLNRMPGLRTHRNDVGAKSASLIAHQERNNRMSFLRLIFVAVGAFCLLMSHSRVAHAGPGSSGGSDLVISQFISAAHAVLDSQNFTEAEREFLVKALTNSEVRTVPKLMDPSSGFNQPVPHQEKLIAYGSEGLIQLKIKTGRLELNESTWEDFLDRNVPVSHYVIHELFRASGALDANGRSIDDAFQITIGKYHLDRLVLNFTSGGKASVGAPKPECRIVARGDDTYGVKMNDEWVDGGHWFRRRYENVPSGIEGRLQKLIDAGVCVHVPRPQACRIVPRKDGVTYSVFIGDHAADSDEWFLDGVQDLLSDLMRLGICERQQG